MFVARHQTVVALAIAISVSHATAAPPTEGAPPPGEESGRVDRPEDGDSTLRSVGRALLAVPRMAFEAAFAPVRAGIWADDRYHLRDRFHDVFFNDANTMGLYPTAAFEDGFGLTGGARFVHRDVFGEREKVALFARAGGRYRYTTSLEARTGQRLGRLSLVTRGELESRPKEGYYGVGNANAAIEARYRQHLLRANAIADLRLVDRLHLRVAGAVADVELARSDEGPAIDELYPMETLTGWGGVRSTYAEVELRWDGRHRVTSFERLSLPSAGTFAGIYAGHVSRLDGGEDFQRYGANVEHLLRIADGPRVLSTRAHVEAVSGASGSVPLTELPQLGGTRLLRGYPTERFRDRLAVVGTLEYEWALSLTASASLFVDAGRVYASLEQLELDGMRLGYGAALELHDAKGLIVRGSLASSVDGGVFLSLSFDDVFELDDRVERR
jgi:hypothetical protein